MELPKRHATPFKGPRGPIVGFLFWSGTSSLFVEWRVTGLFTENGIHSARGVGNFNGKLNT
jgi:hypothetical protein